MILVVAIFLVFLGFVIHKDFFGVTNIIDVSFDGKNSYGKLIVDSCTSWASFFVDFATLPLLILTILFSAHGTFKDSQFQENEIKKLDEIQINISSLRVGQAEKDEDTISSYIYDMKTINDVQPDKPINSVNIDKLEDTETKE